MKIFTKTRTGILIIVFFACSSQSISQELYSAKGYWTELNKSTYKEILDKKMKGDSLSVDQSNYLLDYQIYLDNYYNRMSEEEKLKFEQMREKWDKEAKIPKAPAQEDFSLRTKDRLVNGIYGLYYGASIVAILEIDNAGAAVGIPLIMGGAWQLGPAINPKKYENITLATVRAGNAGKLLGLGYGLAAGLAVSGDSENSYKWMLGLSTIGSITLGEIAFQTQKNRQLSVGHIDIMRHYGFLIPIVTGLGYLAIDENPNFAGVSILAGGVAGLFIGNKAAKKYDYTQGDVDVISSLTWITGGLGAAVAVETIENNTNRGYLLIPAVTAIGGTIFGQRSVKGLHFTSRQGSTISLASGGAALIGAGIVAITEADSPGWYVGSASVCGLIMHQIMFHQYKMKNLENNLNQGKRGNNNLKFSMNVTPENYFISKQLTENHFLRNPQMSYPIVQFKLVF